MTRHEMEEVAEEAATKALNALFLTLGVDVTDPAAVIEFQDDLKHMRKWRRSTEAAQQHALKTIIGVIVSGILGWIGLVLWKHQ